MHYGNFGKYRKVSYYFLPFLSSHKHAGIWQQRRVTFRTKIFNYPQWKSPIKFWIMFYKSIISHLYSLGVIIPWVFRLKIIQSVFRQHVVVVIQLLIHVRLFLWTPWTIAHQAPLSTGLFQARILEWVAISFFTGSSRTRDRTQVSCIAGRLYTF